MGKKKGGKKAQPKNFKVVGSKSLKAKKKTKPVKIGLKKLSKEETKQKLQEVDQQLVKLQDDIVKKPENKKAGRKGRRQRRKKPAKAELAATTSEAIEKLDKMEV